MSNRLETTANPEERVRAIAEVDDWAGNVTEILIGALWDTYPAVRFAAANALADRRLGESNLREIVSRTFSREVSDNARRAALLGLRQPVLSGSLDEIVKHATDPDPIVRYHALLAIDENINAVDLREIATKAIEDDDDDVAVVASQWAAQFGWSEFAPAIDAARKRRKSGGVRLQFAIALCSVADELPDGVVTDLIEGLSDDRTARPAAFAIASAKVRAAIPGLLTVTRKFWFHVIIRIDASAVLASLKEPTGERKLRKFVNDRREHVAAYACECVGRYGLVELEKDVVNALSFSDDRALAAAVALKHLNTESAKSALQIARINHTSQSVRLTIESEETES